MTPTPIMTETPVMGLSNGRRVVLAPMPVKKGEKVCLYTDREPLSCKWEVCNLMGASLKRFVTVRSEGCMETTDLAPGVYLVRLNLVYPDGQEEKFVRKALVTP